MRTTECTNGQYADSRSRRVQTSNISDQTNLQLGDILAVVLGSVPSGVRRKEIRRISIVALVLVQNFLKLKRSLAGQDDSCAEADNTGTEKNSGRVLLPLEQLPTRLRCDDILCRL